MAADSAAIAGENVVIRDEKKLFTAGPFLVGYTTSYRMAQLLRFGTGDIDGIGSLGEQVPYCGECRAREPAENDADLSFMVRKFVPHVRKLFRSGGWSTIQDNHETGGHFIVAYAGRTAPRLYTLESDFQVHPSSVYAAVGSASRYLLGALATLTHNKRPDTAEDAHLCVTEAMFAAHEHCCHIRPPYDICRVDPNGHSWSEVRV